MINLFPKVSNIIDSDVLEALGFVNAPSGYWQLKSTAYGDSQPSTDQSTIIPLVGKGFKNNYSSENVSTSVSLNMAWSINSKSAMAGTAKKDVSGASNPWGNLWADIQSTKFFYPYFYDFDLTDTMNGISMVSDDSSARNTSYTRACAGIYLWLEQVSSSPSVNANMNFPAGSYEIGTSSSSDEDIPLLATYNGSGNSPSTNYINSEQMAGWWQYNTVSSVGSGIKFYTVNPTAYGLFIPAAYDYDLSAVKSAKSTIESATDFTVTHWLVRQD